jgi:hypothetical protein
VHAFDAATDPTSGDPLDPSDVQGHGTRMASVAAGNYAGVAKAANIVAVKKNNNVGAMTRALGYIENDVVNNWEGRAVLSMSFG